MRAGAVRFLALSYLPNLLFFRPSAAVYLTAPRRSRGRLGLRGSLARRACDRVAQGCRVSGYPGKAVNPRSFNPERVA